MASALRSNVAWGVACSFAGLASAVFILSAGNRAPSTPELSNTKPPVSSTAPAPTAPPALAPLPLPPFMDFIERLKFDAAAGGIPPSSVETIFTAMFPDPEVLELATVQPEHIKTTGEYVEQIISESRLETGRQKLHEHAGELDGIEIAHSVERQVLLAIWGIESNFGTNMGARRVLRSLATLAAFDKRRGDFWRTELLAALRIVNSGEASPDVLGSWAGAMGHTQFMPSTFAKHAIDYDRDGKRDIWGNAFDALASTASYLRASGWTPGTPWGFEVVLPDRFDFAHSAPSQGKTLAQWRALGVQFSMQRSGYSLSQWHLILPAGARGPAFLTSGNFHAILKYNNSTSYALAVGLLSDRIAGSGALIRPWPDQRSLSRSDREELQNRLLRKGLVTAAVDGVIGGGTKAAIRAYQKAKGLPEDGHADLALLERLRQDNTP